MTFSFVESLESALPFILENLALQYEKWVNHEHLFHLISLYFVLFHLHHNVRNIRRLQGALKSNNFLKAGLVLTED